MKTTEISTPPRYIIQEKLDECYFIVSYDVLDSEMRNRRCILKMFKNSISSTRIEDVIRYNSEIIIASRMNNKHLHRLYDHGSYNDHNYFVFEYTPGQTLDKLITGGVKFTTDEAVLLVKSLCNGLEYLHKNGIIFRDLSPASIFFPISTGTWKLEEARLLDYGISYLRQFEYDNENLRKNNTVYNYFSPERSGLIKSNMDERSDIYSLGIIFYQMLSGDVLVNSYDEKYSDDNDSLPVSVNEKYFSEVPPILKDIVNRMIEREPEKRYQSIVAIQKDLDLYLQGLRDYALGEFDIVGKPILKTQLIGREKELAALQRMYRNATRGNGGLCLISGSVGAGKSRLVDELGSFVTSSRGFYTSRKCFKTGETVPYGPFREALNIYINNLIKRPEWEQRDIISKFKHELGIFTEILNSFAPIMKDIMGEAPPLAELEPDRETQRFIMVIDNLFKLIGEIEKSFVLHIDNIHWLDEASMQLLYNLVQNQNNNYLLIIGTYRKDEALSDESGFIKFLKQARSRNYLKNEFELATFDEKMMNTLISTTLSQSGQDIDNLSNVIQKKTKGNPYYAIELLKQMMEEGVVYFKNNRWNIKYKKIDSVEISSNIIDLILKRTGLLSPYEKSVFACAAAFGKRINIDLLVILMSEKYTHGISFDEDTIIEITDRDVIHAVDRGLSLQFFEGDLYEKGFISFTHNRIRDVFYSYLTDIEKKEMHSFIAYMIISNNPDGFQNKKYLYYDLAYHYIQAGDNERVIEYAYHAGIYARANFANDEALNYFNLAIDRINEIDDGTENEKMLLQWIKCKEEIGMLYLTTGEIEKAIALYKELLPYKREHYAQAIIYQKICLAYFKTGNWLKCEEYGRKGLSLLKNKLPIGKFSVGFSIVKELIIHFFHNLLSSYYRKERKTTNTEKDSLIIIFYVSVGWMYILSSVMKFINIVLRMLNLCESKIGKSKELGEAMAVYGSMCMAIPLFKRAQRFHFDSLEIREELNDEPGISQSLQWLGYCHSWMGDIDKSNEYFFRGLEIISRMGDLWEMGMNLAGIAYNQYCVSDYHTSITYSREYKLICMKLSDYYGLTRAYQYQAICLIEQGHFASAEEYLKESMAINEEHGIAFNNCVDYFCMGYLYIEQGKYDLAIEYLEIAADMDKKNNFLKEFTVMIYPYLTEAYLRKTLRIRKSSINIPSNEVRFLLKVCKKALKKTSLWKNHHGYALLMYAELLAAINKKDKAAKIYEKSIESFSQIKRWFNYAKAQMYYGEFLLLGGDEEHALECLNKAYNVFSDIDSQEYVKRISHKLGINKENEGPRGFNRFKISKILSMSQEISGIVDMDDLLEQITSKAIELTGARRGCFFVRNDENDELEFKISKSDNKFDTIEYSSHIVEDVYQNGEAIVTVNAERDEIYSDFQSVIRPGLKSVLCMPVKHNDKILGICYLDNPLKTGEFTQQDISILEIFLSHASASIENAYQHRNLDNKVKERNRELNLANEELGKAYGSVSEAYSMIKEDLSIAKNIQQSLFPKIDTIPGIDYFLHFSPMSEVGGDIYDITILRENYIRFFICDATGHGIRAALITMIIKSEYDKIKNIVPVPSQVLEMLNRVIIEYYKSLNMVFSCAVLDVDLDNLKILYSSAGHPAQYLLNDNRIIELNSRGYIIGLTSLSKYKDIEFQIGSGNRVILLTDGVFEQFNDQREPYGEERLVELFSEHSSESIQDIVTALFSDLKKFTGSYFPFNDEDDITLLGITIT